MRQLLTMTSGVKWNEDYTDVNSDVARMYAQRPDPGFDMTVSYVRKLPREAPPGTKWVYKTSETNLVGVLVAEATGKPLADYLSEKIWRPYGMERDAEWMIDDVGHEQGGCCLAMTLRDFGRFGQFILDGARVAGQPIVPDTWLPEATRTQVVDGRRHGLRLPVVDARRWARSRDAGSTGRRCTSIARAASSSSSTARPSSRRTERQAGRDRTSSPRSRRSWTLRSDNVFADRRSMGSLIL